MNKEAIKTFSYRISQASKTELVVIMYDMAQEYLKDAIQALNDDDKIGFCNNIRQVKRVIDELSSGLDMQYEIANEIFVLYMQADKILIRCLARMDNEGLDKVENMLNKLRESFYKLSKDDDSGPVLKNVQQVYAGLTYSSAGGSNEIYNDPVNNRGYSV
jgi:flagellar secretion chaperone FliS